MSDLLKVKVGGSSYLCKWTDNTVTVGNIAYKYVRVGNFYMITENLRYHTSTYKYPNKDSSKESTMGLLYSAYVMFNEIIPILPSGWRVPSKADFQALYSIDSSSNSYISQSDGGTDSLGTNVRLCGYINMSNTAVGFGSKCLMWSTTNRDSGTTWNTDFTKNANLDITDSSRGTAESLAETALSVRIIKDV